MSLCMPFQLTGWLTGFVLAALSSQFWPTLPSLPVLAAMAVFYIWLTIAYEPRCCNSLPEIGRKSSLWALTSLSEMASSAFAGAFAGFIWGASVGHWHCALQLSETDFTDTAVFSGTLLRTQCTEDGMNAVMSVSKLGKRRFFIPRTIMVYGNQQGGCFYAGQQVSGQGRFYSVYSRQNPGSPDKEKYLLSLGVHATAKISTLRITAPASGVQYRAASWLKSHYQVNARWLSALLLGERSGLSPDDWRLLQETGAAHLFSISGLHVGMVVFWLYMIVRWLASAGCGLFRLNVQGMWLSLLIWSIVLIAAAGFAYLTGHALPVIRAVVLLAIGVFVMHCKFQLSRYVVLMIMTAACILFFPHGVYSTGMYLSILAVFIIVLYASLFAQRHLTFFGKCAAMFRLQFVLTVLMLPLSIGIFGVIPWAAIPVNLILLPIVAILVPTGLLAITILFTVPAWAASAFVLPDYLMTMCLAILDITGDILPATSVRLPFLTLTMVFIGVILLYLPRFRGKYAALAVCGGMMATASTVPASDKWYVHIFDVGQGSALAVSRGNTAMLIDTGPTYGSFNSAGDIVIPGLTALGITSLTHVVLTHGDNDHAGGLKAIQTYLKQNGLPAANVYRPSTNCAAGTSLTFQGLKVDMLWPPAPVQNESNNHSCVIRISDGRHRVLIPGDIERSAEYRLMLSGADLRSDVLIAPHHGSITSSTEAFINSVSPSFVVFTQGADNRWNFPAREIVSRYRLATRQLYATSRTGYLRFAFSEDGIQVKSYRDDLSQRWYRPGRMPDNWIETAKLCPYCENTK